MNTQELKDYTKNAVNYCRWFKEEEAMEGLAYYKLKFMELAAKVLSMEDTKTSVTPLASTVAKKTIKPKIDEVINRPTHRINWNGQSKTPGFSIMDKQLKSPGWQAQRDAKLEELYNEVVSKGEEITPDIIQRMAQIVGTTSPYVVRYLHGRK